MGLYVFVYSAMQMLYHAIQQPACAGCYGSAIQFVQDAMGVLSSLHAAYAGAM